MRWFALLIALLFTLAPALPAHAGAGLPKLASLKLGEVQATVLNDSPSLKTGTNLLTLEISDLPAGHQVALALVGPGGQRVPVSLRPLVYVEGVADAHESDGHGEDGAGHGSNSAGHGSSGGGHGAAEAGHGASKDGHGASTGGHGEAEADPHAAAGYAVRGKARISEAGPWKLLLQLTDSHGTAVEAEADLAAEQGGPSRLYLALTGGLMGTTMIYGAVERRRQRGR